MDSVDRKYHNKQLYVSQLKESVRLADKISENINKLLLSSADLSDEDNDCNTYHSIKYGEIMMSVLDTSDLLLNFTNSEHVDENTYNKLLKQEIKEIKNSNHLVRKYGPFMLAEQIFS